MYRSIFVHQREHNGLRVTIYLRDAAEPGYWDHPYIARISARIGDAWVEARKLHYLRNSTEALRFVERTLHHGDRFEAGTGMASGIYLYVIDSVGDDTVVVARESIGPNGMVETLRQTLPIQQDEQGYWVKFQGAWDSEVLRPAHCRRQVL